MLSTWVFCVTIFVAYIIWWSPMVVWENIAYNNDEPHCYYVAIMYGGILSAVIILAAGRSYARISYGAIRPYRIKSWGIRSWVVVPGGGCGWMRSVGATERLPPKQFAACIETFEKPPTVEGGKRENFSKLLT